MQLYNESEIVSVLKRSSDPACGPGLPLYTDEEHCPYVDDSGHPTIVQEGNDRCRACCLTLPYIQSCVQHHESVLIVGRRKDLVYEQMKGNLPPDEQMICVDYSSPASSPNGFNPLELPFQLMRSPNPDHRVEAMLLLDCFLDSVVSKESCRCDQLGICTAARDLIMGVALCMMQCCKREQVNLTNLLYMTQQLDEEGESKTTIADSFEALSYVDHTQYQAFMHAYFSSAEDKKALIQCYAVQALDQFCGSSEIREFIQTGDTAWDVSDLNVRDPFYLCVVFPDESAVEKTAGALISQIVLHLNEQVRHCRPGELTSRVHMVVYGAGNIFIPALPGLAECPQENLFKWTLVLQSAEVQLEVLYGREGQMIIDRAVTEIYFARNDRSTQGDRDRHEECMLVSVNGLRKLQYLSRMPVCRFVRAADKLPAAPRQPAVKLPIQDLLRHLKELNGEWTASDFDTAMEWFDMDETTEFDQLIDECVQLAQANQDEEVYKKIDAFKEGMDLEAEQSCEDDDSDADIDISDEVLAKVNDLDVCWLVVYALGHCEEFTFAELARKSKRAVGQEDGSVWYLMNHTDASALRTRIRCMGGSADTRFLFE